MTTFEIQQLIDGKQNEIFYRDFATIQDAEYWCAYHSDDDAEYKILDHKYNDQ